MNIEQYRDYCFTFEGVSEELPFDPSTLVFKVYGKIFAITNLENFESINLKCDPEMAVELREKYPAVQPGYHMNKKHWNTIMVDNSLPDRLFLEWTRNSYELVLKGISKGKRVSSTQ
jgi:predicted DNA-binding protein (MmcQ/YjbR family)